MYESVKFNIADPDSNLPSTNSLKIPVAPHVGAWDGDFVFQLFVRSSGQIVSWSEKCIRTEARTVSFDQLDYIGAQRAGENGGDLER